MPYKNRIEVMGHAAAPAEFRSETMATFRVATSTRWKDKKTGEDKENTTWHSVAVFGAPSEFMEKELNSIQKGDLVEVAGQFEEREYVDKDTGEVKRAHQIKAFSVRNFDRWRRSKNNKTSTQSNQSEALPLDDVPF